MRYYNNSPYGYEKSPSVTTILGIINKPWLLDWAVKEERNEIVELWWQAYQNLAHYESKDDILSQVEPYKKKHKEISQQAMDLGSLVHGMTDFYWRNFINEYRPWPNSTEEYMAFLSDYYPTEAIKMLGAYFQCLKDHNITILKTEQTVHHYSGFSGTLDMLANVNGVRSIGDLKTGDPDRIGPPARPHIDHRLQTEAYRQCVPHGYNPISGVDHGPEPQGRFIIYLRKGKFAGRYCFWYSDDVEERMADWDAFKAAKLLFERMNA